MREALDLILKCWNAGEPFDWDGKYWRGKTIVALPRPLTLPHMPMATATDTEETLDLAGARGYTLLRAQLEPAGSIRQKADRYARAAQAAGRAAPLANVAVARYVYLADSRREAMDDLRPAINYELGYQKARGLIRIITANYDLGIKGGDDITFDRLAEAGIYFLGEPDSVAKQLRAFHDECGGFGTLLLVAGKNWATREKVFRSMQLFADHVAPQLASLAPARDADVVAA
jgi:alkanesulfonate monooxygenase SsuD/methylene tetrahydromethanopterin reductase-like flavin-dependent oxidoreductase (luciferase family)